MSGWEAREARPGQSEVMGLVVLHQWLVMLEDLSAGLGTILWYRACTCKLRRLSVARKFNGSINQSILSCPEVNWLTFIFSRNSAPADRTLIDSIVLYTNVLTELGDASSREWSFWIMAPFVLTRKFVRLIEVTWMSGSWKMSETCQATNPDQWIHRFVWPKKARVFSVESKGNSDSLSSSWQGILDLYQSINGIWRQTRCIQWG